VAGGAAPNLRYLSSLLRFCYTYSQWKRLLPGRISFGIQRLWAASNCKRLATTPWMGALEKVGGKRRQKQSQRIHCKR